MLEGLEGLCDVTLQRTRRVHLANCVLKRRHPRTTTNTATFAAAAAAAATFVTASTTTVSGVEVGLWGGVVIRCHRKVVQAAVVWLGVDDQVVARMTQVDAQLLATAVTA